MRIGLSNSEKFNAKKLIILISVIILHMLRVPSPPPPGREGGRARRKIGPASRKTEEKSRFDIYLDEVDM